MNPITPFVASLLICSFPWNLSADSPQIRVSIQARVHNGDDARMLGALSHEFRNLDGVSVTDTQPALKIYCDVNYPLPVQSKTMFQIMASLYAASVTIITPDGRLIAHFVETSSTLHQLAQEITIRVDGGVFEPMRRSAKPSSSP